MKVCALRGVCIGVERHLMPDETADVDDATGHFLVSIKAAEEVAPVPEAESEIDTTPAKPGKKGK